MKIINKKRAGMGLLGLFICIGIVRRMDLSKGTTYDNDDNNKHTIGSDSTTPSVLIEHNSSTTDSTDSNAPTAPDTLIELLYRGMQETQVANQKTIIVNSRKDTCHEWISAFPDHLVIMVGITEGEGKSDHSTKGRCLYGSSTRDIPIGTPVEQVPRTDFLIVNEDHPSSTCVQNLMAHVSRPTQYRIIYNNTRESLYTPERHFGCGGIANDNGTSPYTLCEYTGHQGPIISIPAGAASCDKVYPSMVLAPGIHSLTQLQCAWIPHSSFWAMPFLGRFSGTDNIALGMIIEKLLWLTGQMVEVSAPTGHPGPWAQETGKPVDNSFKLLVDVSCAGLNFEQCASYLSRTLVSEGFLKQQNADAFRDWLKGLRQSGYDLPSMIGLPSVQCLNRTLQSFISVRDANARSMKNDQVIRKIQGDVCPSQKIRHNIAAPWKQFDNVLLIVTYNTPGHYDTIPYFETMYRQFYPHILHCGPGVPELNSSTLRDYSFSFMSYARKPLGRRAGSLHYECLIQASRMGYNVDGYLQTSDDIFMNMHRFRHFDTNRAWYYQFNNTVRVDTFQHRACEYSKCENDNKNNKFWHQFRNDTSRSISELNRLQTPAIKRCNENRVRFFGGENWHIRVISDTSYTPSRYVEDVASVLEVFLRHELYLEIALPTALYCIIPEDQFDHIYMDLHNLARPARPPYKHAVSKPTFPDLVILSILENKKLFTCNPRNQPYMYITPQYMQGMAIFHGFKLSALAEKNPKVAQLFCEILKFFGDASGNADKYITKHTFEGKTCKKMYIWVPVGTEGDTRKAYKNVCSCDT